ncbi:glycoside hydrolase [Aspergillus brunneoviolaceus CBS 621.78]|uniref:Glycoside hydrolase n=1 Tax=Aspergillus brunneoviolaceus CBS 621.78 TaxID=1450534 RepID=A0ACD1GD75_9EURO|nr:glycoside hydrolase [Aspergillus brunneoviolaceus CBS 621.78]RAH47118.1 glycoside hydrolase [Aspergillus brunneoviolaceus CBS 621.78]
MRMRFMLLALGTLVVSGVAQAGTATSASGSPPRDPPIVNPTRAPYQDPNLETVLRVEDLLSRMPMREKMAQLMQDLDDTPIFAPRRIRTNDLHRRTGPFFSYPRSTLDLAYRGAQALQGWIMNDTSLSLPAIVQCEGLHGLGLPNATIFTSPIGLGASWNIELMERVAETIGKKARALGITQVFAPSLDLARDPRHVEESYSEDPYLAGEIGAAFVRGLWKSKVASTIKHLAGYGNPEQGICNGPWRAAGAAYYVSPTVSAGVAGDRYDGIPSVSNRYLLTEVLREQWDFQYFTTSDYGGPDRLCETFKMCHSDPVDKEAVTMMVLPAGGDTEGGGLLWANPLQPSPTINFDAVPDLVLNGTLSPSIVDEAVRRVLRAKIDMGLFEDPFPAAPPSDWRALIRTPEALDLATEMDRESIVLLHNPEDILPLAQKSQKLAVIGPFADTLNYGDYIAYRPGGVTPRQGIQNLATNNDESLIGEAVQQAQAADVAVVVVGTWTQDLEGQEKGLNATTGEGYDTNDLRLVGAQRALVQQIIDTGKPTVVVFSSGKPITEPWLSSNATATALIQQFYPSPNGGVALADVLFGNHNPSGRLPVSFPRDVGSLPVAYDYLDSGREIRSPGARHSNGSLEFGHDYVLDTPDVWFGFGHWESYSTFEYSDLQVVPKAPRASDHVTVTVNVKNTSERDGKEVVQLYVVDPISSVVKPNKQLKGFQKVFIRAGETATVSLEVRVSSLGLWDAEMRYVIEPGEFIAHVGRSSTDLRGNVSFFVYCNCSRIGEEIDRTPCLFDSCQAPERDLTFRRKMMRNQPPPKHVGHSLAAPNRVSRKGRGGTSQTMLLRHELMSKSGSSSCQSNAHSILARTWVISISASCRPGQLCRPSRNGCTALLSSKLYSELSSQRSGWNIGGLE